MSSSRARVSLGLENVLEGKGLGVEESARVEYRFPRISALEEKELSDAYDAITGRRVWSKMLPLLRVCHRRHGPDTIPLLCELFEEAGVENLLLRLRDRPPRIGQPSDSSAPTLRLVHDARPQPASPRARPRGQRAEPDRQDPSRPRSQTKEKTPRSRTSIAGTVDRQAAAELDATHERRPAPRGTGPPDCSSPGHDKSWVKRPDGTWTCRTCHP